MQSFRYFLHRYLGNRLLLYVDLNVINLFLFCFYVIHYASKHLIVRNLAVQVVENWKHYINVEQLIFLLINALFAQSLIEEVDLSRGGFMDCTLYRGVDCTTGISLKLHGVIHIITVEHDTVTQISDISRHHQDVVVPHFAMLQCLKSPKMLQLTHVLVYTYTWACTGAIHLYLALVTRGDATTGFVCLFQADMDEKIKQRASRFGAITTGAVSADEEVGVKS